MRKIVKAISYAAIISLALICFTGCQSVKALDDKSMGSIALEDKKIINDRGAVLFDGSESDANYVLGSLDESREMFICGKSIYEGRNEISLISYNDGAIVHNLELPYFWYINGKEPPKWCNQDRSILFAILGDPTDDNVDRGCQTFYLWDIHDRRIERIDGLGWLYHSAFWIEDNHLHYSPQKDEEAIVAVARVQAKSPPTDEYQAF